MGRFMPTWRERIAGEGPSMRRHHQVGIIGGSLIALGTFFPMAVDSQGWYPLLRTGGWLGLFVAILGFAAVALARFRHTSSLPLLGIVAGGITLLLYSNGLPNEATWRAVPWGWTVVLGGAVLTTAAQFCAPRYQRVMVAEPDSQASALEIRQPSLLMRILPSLTFTCIFLDVVAAAVLVLVCFGR